ncbi:phosphoribosylformylglycinamidine synthase II, partial [mine drainage metagenome]
MRGTRDHMDRQGTRGSSADGNPGWCRLDPRAGTAATVAESVLNVACTGARPIALVNCLNFGNPEHPEVMWQLSEAIDGMTEACTALGLPVVGGNVSLYNSSEGTDIDPTPVVAVVT